MDFAQAVEALQRAEDALGNELALAVPDCTDARSLVERICELAHRICELRDEAPGEREVRARCQSATDSCTRAQERLAARCP